MNDRLKEFVQKNSQRAQAIVINTVKSIKLSALLAFNPITWGAIGIILLASLATSVLDVVGSQRFGFVVSGAEPPSLSSMDKDQRKLAITVYLGSIGLNPIASAYMGKIYELGSKDFGYVSDDSLKDCKRTDCLVEKIKKKKLPKNVSFGAYGLKGDMAKKLINTANEKGVDWRNEKFQTEFISDALMEASFVEGSKINSEKTEEVIREVNKLLGISMTDQGISSIVPDITATTEQAKDMIQTNLAMGSGSGLGRTDGGGAVGGDFFSGTGTLDTSSLVAYMESICVPDGAGRVAVGDKSGYSVATPNQIAAKQKAMAIKPDGSKKLYASCDRFVATVVIGLRIDTSIPWGNAAEIRKHLESHKDLWAEVPYEDVKPGDILSQIDTYNRSSASGHVAIIGEGNVVYEASYTEYTPEKHTKRNLQARLKADNLYMPLKLFRYIGPNNSTIGETKAEGKEEKKDE